MNIDELDKRITDMDIDIDNCVIYINTKTYTYGKHELKRRDVLSHTKFNSMVRTSHLKEHLQDVYEASKIYKNCKILLNGIQFDIVNGSIQLNQFLKRHSVGDIKRSKMTVAQQKIAKQLSNKKAYEAKKRKGIEAKNKLKFKLAQLEVLKRAEKRIIPKPIRLMGEMPPNRVRMSGLKRSIPRRVITAKLYDNASDKLRCPFYLDKGYDASSKLKHQEMRF